MLLKDPRVGMVQVVAGNFEPGRSSLLARLQAVIFYGLQLIEQPTRSERREPFQFNGTAGVWRRECIEDAGGWSAGSVVEDLDLSCRAMLEGLAAASPAKLGRRHGAVRDDAGLSRAATSMDTGNAQVLRSMGLRDPPK